MIYISNLKRFKNIDELNQNKNTMIIVTSNIGLEKGCECLVVNYSSYLNGDRQIVDNAGLMCINLLNKINVKSLVLAGFDGFSGDLKENYYEQSLYLEIRAERLADINAATARRFAQLEKQMDLTFITETTYVQKDNKE